MVFSSDSHILPSPTPGPSTCLPNYYRCSSGACVMDSWVCDGYRDCADGSDEEGCPSPGEYCTRPWPVAPALRRGPLGLHPGHSLAEGSTLPSGTLLCGQAPSHLQSRETLGNSEVIYHCPLIFLQGKASRPAFLLGCGWVSFASSPQEVTMGIIGEVSVCIKLSGRCRVQNPSLWLASWRPSY